MAKRTKTITTTVEREKPVHVVAMPVEEAAAACGMGRSMFYILLRQGTIRSFTIGRRRLVPLTALQEFIERQLQDQPARHQWPGKRRRHFLTEPLQGSEVLDPSRNIEQESQERGEMADVL